MDALQSRIGRALDGWTWEQRVEETFAPFDLAPDARVGHALRRHAQTRESLAQAWWHGPACCCWTNRPTTLDLDAIEWLEDLLPEFPAAGRHHPRPQFSGPRGHAHAVELDRGRLLTTYPATLLTTLPLGLSRRRKEAVINARADKLLALEGEVWDSQRRSAAPRPASSV